MSSSASANKQKRSNAFLVPRWGGIYIYPAQQASDAEKSMIDTKEAMKVFITQFLDLIGVNLNKVKKKKIN